MNSDVVLVRISGLDPEDNTEIQRSVHSASLPPEAGVKVKVERPVSLGGRHGEPGTLNMVFEAVRSAAPTVLGLLAVWLEWRKGRPKQEKPKPVTIELTLPSGERIALQVDASEKGVGKSAAEALLKTAEKLASAGK